MKHHIKRFIDWLILTAIILSIGWTVLAVYWLRFDAKPPATFNSPLAVDKAVYKAGESIVVTFDFCRYTTVPVTVHNSLIGRNIVYNLPSRKLGATAKTGCSVVTVSSAVIPEGVAPGTYYLYTKDEFVVNPLAIRFAEWYTVEFEVIGD